MIIVDLLKASFIGFIVYDYFVYHPFSSTSFEM